MKPAAQSKSEGTQVDEKTLRLMRNAKIMMVDDEPINMRVLQLHLNAEGYERFVTISDSRTAISVLREEMPSVLLLDLNMPEVSGLDILKLIRSDDELKQLPVIVLTSSNNTDTKFKALELGATDFLSKPVHASELALRMRNTIVARAYEQQLMHVDALTDLPNRLFFSDYIKEQIPGPGAGGGSRVLVLVNIYRFKSINDSYGSDGGDDVLWAFSQRLRLAFANSVESTTQSDFTCMPIRSSMVMRLGGDRFGVIVNTGKQPVEDEYLHSCIAALMQSLEDPFVIDSHKIFLNVGIGISEFDDTAQGVETLVNRAETAMKNVDSGNGEAFAFYSVDMVAGARRLLDIESAMRTAIADGGMYLAYQPKVDISSGQITGAEALVRWNPDGLGRIGPEEFIPVAESSGLILSIGQWVLEKACMEAAVIRSSGFPDFNIAVNVSILQLYDADFIEGVKRALAMYRLPTHALTIELTENMIMDNVTNCIEKLQVLRALGIRISIDDFGTGYSSLSYLQKFPVDQLKIDRSFIMQIDSVNNCSPIVKAIVNLAHDLGLSVVAEGVETDIQLAYVQALQCEQYQGYIKSKPVAAHEFMKLLCSDIRRAA